ncbi:MAG: hypothetical protein FWE05_10025 [Defluviitaleaceae bacterium]|nr:hypothetical protein [Defluviitaleaceae bacterium]
MDFGESEVIRNEGNCRLLKIGARERDVYCVIGGNKPTLHFDDYEDATEAFNLRWMQEKFGEENQLK